MNKMLNIGMLLKKYESLDDRSVKLIFLSQDVDVDGDAIHKIMKMQGKYLQVAIIERDEPLKESEVPAIKMSSKKPQKSLSKQLRDRLYILWDKMPQKRPVVPFEAYYDGYMKMRLDKIQEMIDGLE